MTITITPADLGRKVKLRNGDIVTIKGKGEYMFNAFRLSNGVDVYEDGVVFRDVISDFDIIAFADEPETKQDTPQPVKTLRDEFAMAALVELVAHYVPIAAAESAYKYADAMMKAREGTNNAE